MAAEATLTPYTICTWPLSNGFHAESRKTFNGYSVSITNDQGESLHRLHIKPQHTFDLCVWKGETNQLHSRLFCSRQSNQSTATLIVVHTASLQIFAYAFSNVTEQSLLQQQLTIQPNEDKSPTVQWTPREAESQQAYDPTANEDMERSLDCLTIAIDRTREACNQRTPCRMIATAAAYKIAELTLYTAYQGTLSALAGGSYVSRLVLDSALKPIASYTVECLGYPGIAIVATVEAVRLANSRFPEHHILDRIQSAAERVVRKFI